MKVGITFSTFDLLHAGHVSMLMEAKDHCDYLIAGILGDPTIDRKNKNKPVQSLPERYIQLESVKYVDKIIPYQRESDIKEILELYQPDVRIIGEEYKGKEFTSKDDCVRLGVEVYFNSRQHDFSSTNLRQRITNAD